MEAATKGNALFSFLGQLGKDCELFQVLFERPGGRAPHDLSSANDFRSENAASRSDHGARLDAGFIADSHLAADHSVVFDDDSA